MARRDIAGQVFGRLTVISYAGNNPQGLALWLSRCECGTRKMVSGSEMWRGRVKSCGCLRVERAAESHRRPDHELTYFGAHQRIRITRGRAASHPCIDCGSPASEWSLRRDSPVTHLAPGSRGALAEYSGNPDDYEPRCKPCHSAYDREVAA